MKRNVTLLVVGLLVVGGGWWIWKQLSKPLPGQKVDDMGRQHVADISEVAYNSNPPTSGPHFALWLKPGVYDRVVSDGYLIHSLEHGYVAISYDCDKIRNPKPETRNLLKLRVYAHETEEPHEEPFGSAQGKPFGTEQGRSTQGEPVATGSARSADSGQAKPLMRSAAPPSAAMSWFTPENPPVKEIELPETFNSEECKKLVDNLRGFVGKKRVVVTPRPGLDSLIALTVWGRILKLERMDKGEIEAFLKAWHNRGPEKTIE